MPNFYSTMPRIPKEPRSRFYPPQGFDSSEQPAIPAAPTPQPRIQTQPASPPQTDVSSDRTATPQSSPSPENRSFVPASPMPERRAATQQRIGEMSYFTGRYPILLQRLYDATDTMLDTYTGNDFLYDAYPDYLSLRLLRDRMLQENSGLTEAFLQAGCPIQWLELLTDTILSEQLCRRRSEKMLPAPSPYLSPIGDASTTSVQFSSRS